MLKALADEESKASKLCLIGINRAGDALIQLAPDLNNRIDTIRFEANPSERVAEVLSKGADALNIVFPSINDLADAACGSFYVAQMLGFRTCLGSGVTERQDVNHRADKPLSEVKDEIYSELDRLFFLPTRAFCRGNRPRPRGRAPYMRLLYWLSNEDNWMISVSQKLATEQEHKGSVGQIAEKGYIRTLIETNDEISRILSWDQESQLLVVQDPQFIFYLRNMLWSKFPQRIGYRTVQFPPATGKKYDVALSFAGSDRHVAEALFEELTQEQYEVFFDKNEESRILAESVEDYLGPIYESESTYVVVLLGREYPKRVWTKFESDHFEARFGENAVIPIWFSDAPPQAFDSSRKVGGLTFDTTEAIKPQITHFAEVITAKLEELAYLEPEESDAAEEVS